MYPQDDKEFYKNVTALKNMDYGNCMYRQTDF